MNARIPNWLRWLVLLPLSLGAGFLAAGLIHLLAIGPAALSYAAAFLSGVAYVWAALYTAHSVAPTHKRAAVTVLGILILGDLSFVHFVMPTDLEVIYVLLRVDDYAGLEHGGVVKVAGAVMGALLAWWKPVSGERFPGRWSIALGALLGAVVCYVAGFTLGIAFFVVAGVLLELTFWIVALKRQPPLPRVVQPGPKPSDGN